MPRPSKTDQLKALITRFALAPDSPATQENLRLAKESLDLLTGKPATPTEILKTLQSLGRLPYAGAITIDLQNIAKPALEKLLDQTAPPAPPASSPHSSQGA